MPQDHTGRYVRRIPRFEPPIQDPCDRHRRYAARRATPHDGRSGRAPLMVPHPGITRDPVDPSAFHFADLAVRLVLEVVDGRRPATQLAGVLEPALVATVAATRRSRPVSDTAVLLRSRLRAVDPRTAELFGSYARGRRVFALAGRIDRAPVRRRAPHGWLVTTLWLG
ncbi:Rv3235 family protein [Rhodococcus chondri]|uniref:Rv3235 family protein n=1 Tax=Rhodococcus chondri TaxID=3065941 RepID=A0ABU7JS51_9NOCA|nr:Rv3235 family protein [Rhodococcus sp. CC-R104]MEE2032850.1 Rv3235 family protein [Rhodococcus sp. CC-R104]